MTLQSTLIELLHVNEVLPLTSAKNNDTKQLWAMLKQTGNWGAKRQTVSGIDINHINDYFADIATDTKYSRDEVINAMLQVSRSVNHHDVNYTKEQVEVMLAKIIGHPLVTITFRTGSIVIVQMN